MWQFTERRNETWDIYNGCSDWLMKRIFFISEAKILVSLLISSKPYKKPTRLQSIDSDTNAFEAVEPSLNFRYDYI